MSDDIYYNRLSDTEIQAKAARIAEIMGMLKKADRVERKPLLAECSHLQRELALGFGARYGFRPTRGHKFPSQLGRRSNRYQDSDQAKWERSGSNDRMWDHPVFYRGWDRRPAMAAVHVYNAPKQDEDGWTDWLIKLADFCQVNGLRFEVVKEEEFPSWYMPGVTQLIAYFPL